MRRWRARRMRPRVMRVSLRWRYHLGRCERMLALLRRLLRPPCAAVLHASACSDAAACSLPSSCEPLASLLMRCSGRRYSLHMTDGMCSHMLTLATTCYVHDVPRVCSHITHLRLCPWPLLTLADAHPHGSRAPHVPFLPQSHTTQGCQ